MEDLQHHLCPTALVSFRREIIYLETHHWCSAIVAILQIEPAFNDPIVHYAALFSLVSALMNLMFGCMYILRFNTMRAPHKAVQWARVRQY